MSRTQYSVVVEAGFIEIYDDAMNESVYCVSDAYDADEIIEDLHEFLYEYHNMSDDEQAIEYFKNEIIDRQ